MNMLLTILSQLELKKDRGLIALAVVLALIVGGLVLHKDIEPKTGLAFLAGVYAFPGFFGRKKDDEVQPPPPPPGSGPYRSMPGIASYEDDEPTKPVITFPSRPGTGSSPRERAWLLSWPAAAALMIVGAVACAVTGCGLFDGATKAAASEAEAAFREQNLACKRQYKEKAEQVACREKVAESWGVVYTPSAPTKDGGK